MRLLPNIRYGTERYSEKVARRLRLVNATTWIIAAVTAGFAIMQFFDPAPGLWKAAVVNTLTAILCIAIPLLHRWSPTLAPLALVAVGFFSIIGLSVVLGTGSGLYFYCILVPALVIPFIGAERILLTAALSVLAAALIVILHLFVPHNTGLQPAVTLFNHNFIPSVVGSFSILFVVVLYALRQIARAEAAAEHEHRRSESLLSNILPPRVAESLKESAGSEIADAYPDASILFADMAGFTERASDTEPGELVRFLNNVFTQLDGLVERHGLEKIKTTGDAYMVVSGVPEPRPDHAEALADLALAMRAALSELVDPKGRAVPIRFGMASGAVVAGVVGSRKFFYDVWGDAVNTASRMESTGEAGKIQVAPETHARLQDQFELEERGLIDVRGKGQMRTWFLIGRKK